MFVCSTSNSSAIADHIQSATDTDKNFKTQLNVEDPRHRKPLIILLNWLIKSGEWVHDRNLFLPRGGFEPITSNWQVSVLRYRRAAALMELGGRTSEKSSNLINCAVFINFSKTVYLEAWFLGEMQRIAFDIDLR